MIAEETGKSDAPVREAMGRAVGMARCVHGVPLGGSIPCPTCTPPAVPICGIQEDSRRGWISVCVLPQGHPRTGPVKHRFEWMKGHPDADPNGPGPEPTTDLPQRTPTPAPEPDLPEPPQLGYRRRRTVTPPPRRGDRRVGFPLGDPDRVRRGGEQFTSERDSDANTDDYGSPIPAPLPAGVEGHPAGSPNRGEGNVDAGGLIAAIDATQEQIAERQGHVREVIDALDVDTQRVLALAGMTNMPAHVHTTAARLQQTAHHLENEVMQGLSAAIEELETWKGQIVQ